MKINIFLIIFQVFYIACNSSGTLLNTKSCQFYINDTLYNQKSILGLSDEHRIGLISTPSLPKSPVLAYSIDLKCQSTNVSSNLHFSFEIKSIPIEINMINCSKNLFLKNFNVFNNLTFEIFWFETQFKSINYKMSNLEMRLSLNKRLGNGCYDDLIFVYTLDSSKSTLELIKQYWDSLITNPISLLLLSVLLFVLLLIIVNFICKIRRRFTCTQKHLKLSVPFVAYKAKPKNIIFDSIDCGVDNNINITDNLDAQLDDNHLKRQNVNIIHEDIEEISKKDQSVQVNLSFQYEIVKNQFEIKETENKKNRSELVDFKKINK